MTRLNYVFANVSFDLLRKFFCVVIPPVHVGPQVFNDLSAGLCFAIGFGHGLLKVSNYKIMKWFARSTYVVALGWQVAIEGELVRKHGNHGIALMKWSYAITTLWNYDIMQLWNRAFRCWSPSVSHTPLISRFPDSLHKAHAPCTSSCSAAKAFAALFALAAIFPWAALGVPSSAQICIED